MRLRAKTAPILLMILVGCRSQSNEVVPPHGLALEKRDDKVVETKRATDSIVGLWIRPVEEGQIELGIEPTELRFAIRLKESTLTMIGSYREETKGRLLGRMDAVQIEGQGFSLKLAENQPFELTYEQTAQGLKIGAFRGGGWDERGQQNFEGVFHRTQLVRVPAK